MKFSLEIASEPKKAARVPPRRLAKEPEAFLPEENPAEQAVGGGRTILVVDDNPVILKAFEFKLKRDGFNVVTSTESAQVAGTARQSKPELIILDVNFPSSGGVEWNAFNIVQWIRRFPELSATPIIMMSGSDEPRCKERAMEAGARAFFTKPLAYRELLELILQILPPCQQAT